MSLISYMIQSFSYVMDVLMPEAVRMIAMDLFGVDEDKVR